MHQCTSTSHHHSPVVGTHLECCFESWNGGLAFGDLNPVTSKKKALHPKHQGKRPVTRKKKEMRKTKQKEMTEKEQEECRRIDSLEEREASTEVRMRAVKLQTRMVAKADNRIRYRIRKDGNKFYLQNEAVCLRMLDMREPHKKLKKTASADPQQENTPLHILPL